MDLGFLCETSIFVLVIDLSHTGFPGIMFVFLAVPKTRLCLKPKLIIERKKKRLYFIASETKLVNKNCYLPLGFSRANFGCLVGLLVDFWLRIVGFAWYHIIV